MDPFIGGALISGVGSLLGGLFGQSSASADRRFNAEQIEKQNEYNKPINIRKRAEEGGFNPLSFIGPGVGLQTGVAQANSGNYMGAAIADAGMAFAGAMADKAKFAETKKLNALEMDNAKLQNKLLQLTLRPKYGGVYADRQSTPTIQAAVGGGNAATSGVGSTGAAGGSVPDGLSFGGVKLPHDKATSTADQATSLYGEGVEVLWGAGSLARDLVIAASKPEFKSWAAGVGRAADRAIQRKAMEVETSRRQWRADHPSISLSHPGHTSDAWWKSQRNMWWQ